MNELLSKLRIMLAKLMAQLENKTLLDKFCEGIQSFEGWTPNSRSWRNCNPGNIKYGSLAKELGAYGQDDLGFAKFADSKSGFQALKEFVSLACRNKLKAYKADMTIYQYFCTYAPSNDGNSPIIYSKSVAKKCGLSITDKISNLL